MRPSLSPSLSTLMEITGPPLSLFSTIYTVVSRSSVSQAFPLHDSSVANILILPSLIPSSRFTTTRTTASRYESLLDAAFVYASDPVAAESPLDSPPRPDNDPDNDLDNAPEDDPEAAEASAQPAAPVSLTVSRSRKFSVPENSLLSYSGFISRMLSIQ